MVRDELYSLLEKTKLSAVPFVHLRSDMLPDEIEYFRERWHTRVFNTHAAGEFPQLADWTDFKKYIYIENTRHEWQVEEITKFAGTCLDYAHLENDRLLKTKAHAKCLAILKQFPPGCGHVSAIRAKPYFSETDKEPAYDAHRLVDISELDYLKRYFPQWLPPLLAIELENSLAEQLEVIKHVRSLV